MVCEVTEALTGLKMSFLPSAEAESTKRDNATDKTILRDLFILMLIRYSQLAAFTLATRIVDRRNGTSTNLLTPAGV